MGIHQPTTATSPAPTAATTAIPTEGEGGVSEQANQSVADKERSEAGIADLAKLVRLEQCILDGQHRAAAFVGIKTVAKNRGKLDNDSVLASWLKDGSGPLSLMCLMLNTITITMACGLTDRKRRHASMRVNRSGD